MKNYSRKGFKGGWLQKEFLFCLFHLLLVTSILMTSGLIFFKSEVFLAYIDIRNLGFDSYQNTCITKHLLIAVIGARN